MTEEPLRRGSTSQITGKRRIKTTVKYKLTHISMAPTINKLIKKQKIISVGKDVGKLEPFMCRGWNREVVQLLRKTVWQLLKKIENRIIT